MSRVGLTTGNSGAADLSPAVDPVVPELRGEAGAADRYAVGGGGGVSKASESSAPARESPALRASRVIELSKLGYPAPVANRIVESYPNIAAEIIRLAEKQTIIPRVGEDRWSYYYHGQLAAEPVTLYRGINAEVVESDRTATSTKLPTALSFNYLSPELGYPIMRALWSAGVDDAGRTRGVLMEMVVPKYLVFGDYHPSLYEGRSNTYVGGMHPVTLMDMIPDLRAFAHRVGVVPFTRDAANRKDSGDVSLIQWQAPNQLEPFLVSKAGEHDAIEVTIARPARWLEAPQPLDYAAHVGVPNIQLGFV